MIVELSGASPAGPRSGLCPGPVGLLQVRPKSPTASVRGKAIVLSLSAPPLPNTFRQPCSSVVLF